MKKLFCVFFLLSLCGCASGPQVQAEQTVSDCLSAMDRGHLDAAEQYVDKNHVHFISDISDNYSGIDELLNEYHADSETRKKMDDALVKLTDAAVSSTAVSSAQENGDGSCTVPVKVSMVPSSEISNVLQKADLDSYLAEIQDDVMKVYDESGEEEAWQYALGRLADFVADNCTEEMKKAEKEDLDLNFRVKKVNDSWIITSIDTRKS